MRPRQFTYLSLILIAAAVAVPVFMIAGTILAFWLLPIVFFIGCLCYPFLKRQMHNAACRTGCRTCGKLLGKRSVEIAQAWTRDAVRAPPRAYLHTPDAICEHCSAWYVFDFDKGEFEAADRPHGAHLSRGKDILK